MTRYSRLNHLGIVLISAAAMGCTVFGVHGVEEPSYTVVASDNDKEIRAYGERIVATTTVKGPWKEAQNKAFRILAGYIFGKNQTSQQIAMTTPVEQTGSMNIAMTAPVEQTGSDAGWTVAFTMPSEYDMEDLPYPLDSRIQLKVIPPRYMAAISYSWYASEEENRLKARELRKWVLGLDEWVIGSNPGFAGYDPPWTLPFLRTNEATYELMGKSGQAGLAATGTGK